MARGVCGTAIDDRMYGSPQVTGLRPVPVTDVPERTARRAQVLLAEDDDAMRELLVQVLREDGNEVIAAPDLETLCDLAAASRTDAASIALIISDIRMPDWSGIEFLASLRAAHWTTPVLLITAFGSEEVHQRAETLGALRVLDKPFAVEQLRDLVRMEVGRHRDAGQ